MKNEKKQKILKKPEKAMEEVPEVVEQLMELLPEATEEAILDELEELTAEYPDAEIETLCHDEQFCRFAGGKMMPLTEIYAEYLAFCEAVEKRIQEKQSRRKNRATGSGRARTEAAQSGLNDGQFAFLTAWNREYPEYAMTAKEYAAALKG